MVPLSSFVRVAIAAWFGVGHTGIRVGQRLVSDSAQQRLISLLAFETLFSQYCIINNYIVQLCGFLIHVFFNFLL